jgi:hypothetical protein
MDKFTTAMLKVLSAKKSAAPKAVDPYRVSPKLPSSRIPISDSIVSFNYLLKNAIKYQPDEENSELVEFQNVKPRTFRTGAKGLITSTLTDLPQYNTVHRWEQVFRCTPVDYTGKISDCPSIVFNCNCPRFTFVWNWALWSKNASVLNATNQPPDITNPRRLLGTCKHGIVAMKAIKKRGL